MKIDEDAAEALRAVVKSQGTQLAAAKRLGCSEAYVSDLLRGRRGFSDEMLGKLGLRRTIIADKAVRS